MIVIDYDTTGLFNIREKNPLWIITIHDGNPYSPENTEKHKKKPYFSADFLADFLILSPHGTSAVILGIHLQVALFLVGRFGPVINP